MSNQQERDNQQWIDVMNLTDRRVLFILMGVALLTSLVSLVVEVATGDGAVSEWFGGFLQNFGTEMFGAFLTFWLLEILVRERRQYEAQAMYTQNEKDRLKRQMRSRVKAQAQRAIEELRARGWLNDGTLQEMGVKFANWQDSMLHDADLQYTTLRWVKLQRAELFDTDFRGADLCESYLSGASMRRADFRGARLLNTRLKDAKCREVNFEGADLTRIRAQGAKLVNANLRNAVLTDAFFDARTILPDGRRWSEDTDMKRYTDPEHPEFWQPDWVVEQDASDNRLNDDEDDDIENETL